MNTNVNFLVGFSNDIKNYLNSRNYGFFERLQTANTLQGALRVRGDTCLAIYDVENYRWV